MTRISNRKFVPIFLVWYFLIFIAKVDSQWYTQNRYLSPTHKTKQFNFNNKQQLQAASFQHRQFEESPTPPPTPSPPQPYTTTPTPPFPVSSSASSAIPPRCGEAFNCTSSGIFHKPFEPVFANERCVWTVNVPGASGYTIDVLYLGWDPLENGGASNQVIINGFRRGSPPTEYSPNGKGVLIVNDATLLVITFISGSNPRNSTGFILQYTTLTNGTVPTVAAQSKHQLIRPDTIYLRHPSASSNYYQNNELSSFVFEPEDNIHVEGQRSNIVYMRISLDGASCGDYLDVYGLNVTKQQDEGGQLAKWDFRGRICGFLDTQLITGDDMLMIIFQTDQGGTNYGFHLTYTTC